MRIGQGLSLAGSCMLYRYAHLHHLAFLYGKSSKLSSKKNYETNSKFKENKESVLQSSKTMKGDPKGTFVEKYMAKDTLVIEV